MKRYFVIIIFIVSVFFVDFSLARAITCSWPLGNPCNDPANARCRVNITGDSGNLVTTQIRARAFRNTTLEGICGWQVGTSCLAFASYPTTGSYTVSCTCDKQGPSGSANAPTYSCNFNPPTVVLTCNGSSNCTVAAGSNVTMNWTVSNNATSCDGTGGVGTWAGSKASGNGGHSGTFGPVNSTTSFTITCSNAYGSTSDTSTATVSVPASPPTVDLTCGAGNNQSCTIISGSTTSLTWTTTGLSAGGTCTASNGTPDWTSSPSKAIAGGTQNPVGGAGIVSPTVYTISCTNPNGTATDSLIVDTIANVPPTPQSAYQIQIDDDSGGFFTGGIFFDSGKILDLTGNIRSFIFPISSPSFNTNYRARVRVWDGGDQPSTATTMTICNSANPISGCDPGQTIWRTPTNQYPQASFIFNPPNPAVNQIVLFNSTSTCYDADGTCDSWLWDFGDGNTSTLENPEHSYGSEGPFTVSLSVSDANSYTCNVSASQPINPSKPVPFWKEVLPR